MTTPSITEDRLLNKVETASAMRVSVFTVDKWVRHGTGPKHVKYGIRVYFRESELNRWIDERTRASTHRKADQVAA